MITWYPKTNKTMRKLFVVFTSLTLLFIATAFVIKSKYYYYPYPNLIEYLCASILFVVMGISLPGRTKTDKINRIVTGTVCIVILLGTVNFLNYIFRWHPLTLQPPFSSSQSFEVDSAPYAWPTASPETYCYNSDTLSAYFNKLDEWKRLRALLILKDDNLIIEKYFAGTTQRSAFNVHSVTKSITSALVGLAIQHCYINSENDLMLSYFPEHRDRPFGDYKKRLNIQHLLSMRGGWGGGDGHQTATQSILNEHLHTMPDSEFRYFTGSHNILSAIIARSTGQSTREFANEYLFRPLGIQNAFWRETGGYYCGGDESYFTARDLARFGSLFLNRGNINGKQILDPTWIDKTFTNYTSESPDFQSLDCYDEVGYGLSWWILKTRDNHIIYTARGKGGQYVLLLPHRNIVVVILQDWNPWQRNRVTENRLLGELLEIL
jgi:CubicO group peptidase (beta-lactamase class C family)